MSERDILDAVKPLEEKYKVYSYPTSREVLESNLLESESTYDGKTTKKTTFMTRIKTVYRFVNTEKPDEYIETITFAEGIDSQDKGSGKAMTYADKYALMKAYKISTGDDPDFYASEAVKYTQKTGTYKKPEAKPETKYATPREHLINLVKQKGFDLTEYANEKGINKSTPEERINELIKELEG